MAKTTLTFNYTGALQTFVVPAGVFSVVCDAYGAAGGLWGGGSRLLGGRVQATIAVTPGETLSIFVGQQGPDGQGASTTRVPGGFNGGGTGGAGSSSGTYVTGSGGGGATDIRRGGTALGSRILVAGGAGGWGSDYPGAHGGGLVGDAALSRPDPGYGNAGGKGGTQTAGGARGTGAGGSYQTDSTAGTLGQGGQGGTQSGGGGGGGFYGGGGGCGWSMLDNGGGGGGSSLVPSGGSTTTGVRSGNGLITLTYNQPPTAPTLTAPAGGETVPRTATVRLAATFADLDPGDSPSKSDWRYRLVGAPAWTTVTQNSPSQFLDVAAGTFPAGDIEWQARYYDQEAAVGAWSASGFFTAATPPAGLPAILDPVAGATIPDATQIVTFSYASLQQWQWRLLGDGPGQVADPAVVLNAGATVIDGRSFTLSGLANGVPVHPQVRVQENGLWSEWTTQRNPVSYTPPATPTVEAIFVGTAVQVTATHPAPAGSEPAVTTQHLRRRLASTGGDGIRIGADLPPTQPVLDRRATDGVTYEYAIDAIGANGTTARSAWVSVASADPAPPPTPAAAAGGELIVQ